MIFAIIWSFAGITMGLVFMAFVYLFYAVISLVSLVRLGNPWYMATLIFQLSIVIFALTAPEIGPYEILELAAMNINETGNGFTERPKPLGKIDARPGDITGFCSFLKSHLIAVSFAESTQTVIVPIMMGNEYKLPLGLSSDYSQSTRIIIDKENNVSAVISKKDYLKYKEALSFDQLCESLGQLFMVFFEHYQRGEETRIMHEISKIKIGPFS